MIITTRGFKKPADTEPYAIKDSNDNVDKLEEILDVVDQEMDQLFQSVSNGKTLVAGAITDKGVNTSPTDTFLQMANNIDAIVTDPSIGTTDAVASDILLGKKVVSQGNLLTGTMPNNGPAVAETINLTNQNQEYTIAQGSHSGLRKIKAVITNLAAGVIKAGVTVGGILGTFTSDATATAAQMLAGAKAYVNGILVTGTIPSKTGQTYTPGTTNQNIASGQYLSGNQTIQGSANLVPENIKNGVNIFGVVGNVEPSPVLLTATTQIKCNVVPTGTYSGKISPNALEIQKASGASFVTSAILISVRSTFTSSGNWFNAIGAKDFYAGAVDGALRNYMFLAYGYEIGTLIFNPNRTPITLTASQTIYINEFII